MLCKRTDPSLQHAAKRIPRPLSSPISEKGTGCHFKHLIVSQGEILKQAKKIPWLHMHLLVHQQRKIGIQKRITLFVHVRYEMAVQGI